MNKDINQNNRRGFLSKILVAGTSGIAIFSSSTYANSINNTCTILTEDQKDVLFYIYQEEKVARDVYITLGNIYTNETTFAAIQVSEQRHMDSARELCETYGVSTDGVSTDGVDEENVGSFVLPVLQEIYDTYVSEGGRSLFDALKIGEIIEYTDIEDLEHATVGMPADVVSVYESLKEGSLSHLDAFQAAITRTT